MQNRDCTLEYWTLTFTNISKAGLWSTLRIQPVVPRRVPPHAGVVPSHEPPHPLPLLGPLLGVLPPIPLPVSPAALRRRRFFSFHMEWKEKLKPFSNTTTAAARHS
jgi:hypothetical protein